MSLLEGHACQRENTSSREGGFTCHLTLPGWRGQAWLHSHSTFYYHCKTLPSLLHLCMHTCLLPSFMLLPFAPALPAPVVAGRQAGVTSSSCHHLPRRNSIYKTTPKSMAADLRFRQAANHGQGRAGRGTCRSLCPSLPAFEDWGGSSHRHPSLTCSCMHACIKSAPTAFPCPMPPFALPFLPP